MRWKRGRRSDNVVDARGSGSRMSGGKGLTLGGVAIVVIVGLLSGQDPMQILGTSSRAPIGSTRTRPWCCFAAG